MYARWAEAHLPVSFGDTEYAPIGPKCIVESRNNGECFEMHHDMGDPPSPNPAEEGEHPHLAFGLNFEIFYELGYR